MVAFVGYTAGYKNEKHNLRSMSLADAVSSLSICGLGIILNCCEIASLIHAKKTKLPFDITLISLAISDVLLALFIAILAVFMHVFPNVPTSTLYGKIFIFFLFSLSLSSSLHVFFIATQRLIAVLYPLKVSIWITRKRSAITLLLLWVISIVASTPMTNYTYQRIVIWGPFVSTAIIIACYFVISFKMLKRKTPAIAGHQSQNISVLTYAVAITAIFIVCTFPFTIFAVQQQVPVEKMTFPTYVATLFYLQVILDPIVYFFSQVCKRNSCRIRCIACCCGGSGNVSAN